MYMLQVIQLTLVFSAIHVSANWLCRDSKGARWSRKGQTITANIPENPIIDIADDFKITDNTLDSLSIDFVPAETEKTDDFTGNVHCIFKGKTLGLGEHYFAFQIISGTVEMQPFVGLSKEEFGTQYEEKGFFYNNDLYDGTDESGKVLVPRFGQVIEVGDTVVFYVSVTKGKMLTHIFHGRRSLGPAFQVEPFSETLFPAIKLDSSGSIKFINGNPNLVRQVIHFEGTYKFFKLKENGEIKTGYTCQSVNLVSPHLGREKYLSVYEEYDLYYADKIHLGRLERNCHNPDTCIWMYKAEKEKSLTDECSKFFESLLEKISSLKAEEEHKKIILSSEDKKEVTLQKESDYKPQLATTNPFEINSNAR